MLRNLVVVTVLVFVGSRAAAEPAPKAPASDPLKLPPILTPPKPGERAFLGVVLDPQFTEDMAKGLGLTELTGALVLQVAPRAPADVIGIQPGDVILQFRGVTVKDQAHLVQLVPGARPGATAALVLWRNGQKVPAKAVLRDMQEYLKTEQKNGP